MQSLALILRRKLSHLAGAAGAENLCEEEMNCAAAISIILWQNFLLIPRMEGSEKWGSAFVDHRSRNIDTDQLKLNQIIPQTVLC